MVTELRHQAVFVEIPRQALLSVQFDSILESHGRSMHGMTERHQPVVRTNRLHRLEMIRAVQKPFYFIFNVRSAGIKTFRPVKLRVIFPA